MQNNSTQDNINNHLLWLSKKEVHGIPSWELLYTVVQELKHNSSVDKSRYVSQLYWAIKDLFSLDYNAVIEVVGIDEAAHSVTQVCSRYYANKVGLEKQPPITTVYDEQHFNTLYAGRSLEHFNQNPVAFKSIKLNKYTKERSLSQSLEDEEDGSYDHINWVIDGTDAIERKIDDLFKPVIDMEWPRTTFEKFIEKCKSTPTPPATDKSTKGKRNNDDAKRRHQLIYQLYDQHIKNGFIHKAAIEKLAVNLKREFRTSDLANLRKSIARILRQRNNKEQ